MPEPKLVRGLLGWAAVGDGFTVYAKTRAEALRRYEAAASCDAAGSRISEELEVELEPEASDS